MGPEEQSAEYEILLNNFNCRLTQHCNCDKVCSIPLCECLLSSHGANYSSYLQNKQLKYKLIYSTVSLPIFECNSMCSCSSDCGNRIVQKGPIKGLEIRSCDKGLGLFTTSFIPEGTFICEYAGEVITSNEAARRHQANLVLGKMNYIFCLNEHCGANVVKTFVDPSVFGNIGRYLNHSCEPNCHVVPVRCETPIVKLAIFALIDILPNDELTFNYGSSNVCDSKVAETRTKCLCKCASCTGFIPFHIYNQPILMGELRWQ